MALTRCLGHHAEFFVSPHALPFLPCAGDPGHASDPLTVASCSCSASLGACQAEHHERHCQPEPVCHPGLRCRRLSRAHRDVDKVRCCVQCPAGLGRDPQGRGGTVLTELGSAVG